MIEVTSWIVIPASELSISFARSSGPGGQNVNKVNSKAVVVWDLANTTALPSAVKGRFLDKFASRLRNDGALVIASDRFREQKRNVEDCFDRIRTMILQVIAPPKSRRPTKPTRGSVEKRIQVKKQRSSTKKGRQRPEDPD